MYSSKTRKGASLKEVITYTLPKLHIGKNWYVDFLAYDPVGKATRLCPFWPNRNVPFGYNMIDPFGQNSIDHLAHLLL